MDAHEPVADTGADFSQDGLGLLSECREEEQTALDLLRLRLDTIAAKVSRLEVAFRKQSALWRREVGYAAIIGALLMLSGLLGSGLVWRLL
jgi:hypothetical protein